MRISLDKIKQMERIQISLPFLSSPSSSSPSPPPSSSSSSPPPRPSSAPRTTEFLCQRTQDCGQGAECIVRYEGLPSECFCLYHLRYPNKHTGDCSSLEEDPPIPNPPRGGVISHDHLKDVFFPNATLHTVHSEQTSNDVKIAVVVPPMAGLVLLVVAAVCCLLRRRRNMKRTPEKLMRNGDGALLLDQMNTMTSNPNYFAPKAYPCDLARRDVREVPIDQLRLLETVGEGAFGQVFKGYLYMPNDLEYVHVAVKVLKEGASPEALDDFQREVGIMATFRHDNILRLLGVVTQANERSPFMIFEFMEFGDLNELLRRTDPHHPMRGANKRRIPMTKTDLVDFSLQIAKGMSYLATQRFVHRDLATRNCLVNSKMVVKISDFGMSHDIYNNDYYKISGSRMVPVRWLSPEAVKFGRFTTESDIWAYGVLLWEIFSVGKQPYYGHSNEEVICFLDRRILLQKPEHSPATIYHAMLSCWQHEPKQRVPFYKIVCYLTQYKTRLASAIATGVRHDQIGKHDESLIRHPTKDPNPNPQPPGQERSHALSPSSPSSSPSLPSSSSYSSLLSLDICSSTSTGQNYITVLNDDVDDNDDDNGADDGADEEEEESARPTFQAPPSETQTPQNAQAPNSHNTTCDAKTADTVLSNHMNPNCSDPNASGSVNTVDLDHSQNILPTTTKSTTDTAGVDLDMDTDMDMDKELSNPKTSYCPSKVNVDKNDESDNGGVYKRDRAHVSIGDDSSLTGSDRPVSAITEKITSVTGDGFCNPAMLVMSSVRDRSQCNNQSARTQSYTDGFESSLKEPNSDEPQKRIHGSKTDLRTNKPKPDVRAKRKACLPGFLLSSSCRDLCAIATSPTAPLTNSLASRTRKRPGRGNRTFSFKHLDSGPFESITSNNSYSSFVGPSAFSGQSVLGRLDRTAMLNAYSNSINELNSSKSTNSIAIMASPDSTGWPVVKMAGSTRKQTSSHQHH